MKTFLDILPRFKYIMCYIIYNFFSERYRIVREEDLYNDVVFNLEIENDVLLMVSIRRKIWRINREIRNKTLQTHISIVSFNKNSNHKCKRFSDYEGITKSYDACT